MGATNLAVVTRAAERKRGSQPTSKAVARIASHRPAESIKSRRIKRLARSIDYRCKSGNEGRGSILEASQHVHWESALIDGIVEEMPVTQIQGLEILEKARKLDALDASKQARRQWLQQIVIWSTATMSAA